VTRVTSIPSGPGAAVAGPSVAQPRQPVAAPAEEQPAVQAAAVATGLAVVAAGSGVGRRGPSLHLPSLRRRKSADTSASDALGAGLFRRANPSAPDLLVTHAPAPAVSRPPAPRVSKPPTATPRPPMTPAPSSLADRVEVVHVDSTGIRADAAIPGYTNDEFERRRETSVKGSAYDVPAGQRLPGQRIPSMEKPPKVVLAPGNASKRQWRWRFWKKEPDAHQKAIERPWDSLPEVAPKRRDDG
jgi:hypothetical protein